MQSQSKQDLRHVGKPTPGPWHVKFTQAYQTHISGPYHLEDEEGTVRAEGICCEEHAHLIAAAPDGYVLARLILETNDVPEGLIRSTARAFVAKAEGKV